jgi:hypothetical protein
VHPRAAGKEILLVSRLASLTFGLLSGVFCIVLLQIGININWLFFVIGWVACSCSAPVCIATVCLHACASPPLQVAGRSEALSIISQHGRHWWFHQALTRLDSADCRLLVASVFPPISLLLTWNKVGKVRQHVSMQCHSERADCKATSTVMVIPPVMAAESECFTDTVGSHHRCTWWPDGCHPRLARHHSHHLRCAWQQPVTVRCCESCESMSYADGMVGVYD